MEELKTETKETSIGHLMKNYAAYNLWANRTLIYWLKTKSTELLEKEVGSSFPSIKGTLIHIWQVQEYWFSIIRKSEPGYSEFDGTIDEIYNRIIDQSEEMVSYIDSLNEERIAEKIKVDSPWFKCNFNNFEYIMHVVNHGTYHRGQLTSIGRRLGFTDAPMTDYNFFNIDGH